MDEKKEDDESISKMKSDNTLHTLLEKKDELSIERDAVINAFSTKDSILDPDCIHLIKKWFTLSKKKQNQSDDLDERKKYLEDDVKLLIDKLSSSYEGSGVYTSKLIEWINLLKGKNEKGSGQLTKEYFHNISLKESTIEKVRFLVDHLDYKSKKPPEWLIQMLNDKTWRNFLIVLSTKYENFPLFDFCVQVICNSGLHAEITAVTKPSTYLIVFKSTLLEILCAILDVSPLDDELQFNGENSCMRLINLEASFLELSLYSHYTFLLVLNILEDLETHLEKKNSSFLLLKKLKIQRLCQTLFQDSMSQNINIIEYNQKINQRHKGGLSSSEKSGGMPELAQLLRTVYCGINFDPNVISRIRHIYDPSCNSRALLYPLWPLRNKNIGYNLTVFLFDPFTTISQPQVIPDAAYILGVISSRKVSSESHNYRFETTVRSAIESASKICRDPSLMQHIENIKKDSNSMLELASLIRKYAPISAGFFIFARSLINSPKYQSSESFLVGMYTLIHLIGIAQDAHFSQHNIAFFTLFSCLQLNFQRYPAPIILEFRKAVLDQLIMLMKLGFVSLVLDHLRIIIHNGSLDQVLIRYFITRLGLSVEKPLSLEFCDKVLLIVNHENCTHSIKSNSTLGKIANNLYHKLRNNCNNVALEKRSSLNNSQNDTSSSDCRLDSMQDFSSESKKTIEKPLKSTQTIYKLVKFSHNSQAFGELAK